MPWSSQRGRCGRFDKRGTIAKRISTIQRGLHPHVTAFTKRAVLRDEDVGHGLIGSHLASPLSLTARSGTGSTPHVPSG